MVSEYYWSAVWGELGQFDDEICVWDADGIEFGCASG